MTLKSEIANLRSVFPALCALLSALSFSPGRHVLLPLALCAMLSALCSTPARAGLDITQGTSANVARTNASVYATIVSTNGTTNAVLATVYYGTSDGATNSGSWSSYMTVTNPALGLVSNNLISLTPSQLYYYRWCLAEGISNDWSGATSNFTTLAGVPTGAAPTSAYHSVMVDTTGALKAPTNFWAANTGGLATAGMVAQAEFQSSNAAHRTDLSTTSTTFRTYLDGSGYTNAVMWTGKWDKADGLASTEVLRIYIEGSAYTNAILWTSKTDLAQFLLTSDTFRAYLDGLGWTNAITWTGKWDRAEGLSTVDVLRAQIGLTGTAAVAAAQTYTDTSFANAGVSNRFLVSSTDGRIMVDWDAGRILYDGYVGDRKSLDWWNRRLYYENGKTSVLWQASQLRDSAGVLSFDWEARLLFDSSGVNSVNGESRTLQDNTGKESVDWWDRTLNDSAETAMLDWQNRRLQGDSWNIGYAAAANAGGRVISNLANAVASTDAATYGQVGLTGTAAVAAANTYTDGRYSAATYWPNVTSIVDKFSFTIQDPTNGITHAWVEPLRDCTLVSVKTWAIGVTGFVDVVRDAWDGAETVVNDDVLVNLTNVIDTAWASTTCLSTQRIGIAFSSLSGFVVTNRIHVVVEVTYP